MKKKVVVITGLAQGMGEEVAVLLARAAGTSLGSTLMNPE